MRGPIVVLLLLILASEIVFCAAGVWRIFRVKDRGDLAAGFCWVLSGMMIERITAIIAMQYRPSGNLIKSKIELIRQQLTYNQVSVAIGSLADLQKTIVPTTEYEAWLISGRLVCAICVIIGVRFLFGLKSK